MEIYTVAFFGHRYIDTFSRAENGVESIVRDLLNSHEYVDFLIGRDGDFDQIVSSTVKRMKRAIRDDNSSLTWPSLILRQNLKIIMRIMRTTTTISKYVRNHATLILRGQYK